MRLFLLRHATTDWSISGRHTGRTDIPLNAEGEREAELAGQPLKGFRFDRVFTSPLKRARQTADLVGLGSRAETMESLVEVDYGRDEGRTKAEITRDRPGWDLLRDGPLDGETLAQATARARRCLDAVAESEGNVLFVSHGHMLRILAATYCGQPPDWALPLGLGTASLSLLEEEQGRRIVGFWNMRCARLGAEVFA